MLQLVCFLLVLLFYGKCASSMTDCPTWTYPSPSYNDCVCGDTFGGIIVCDSAQVAIDVSYYCMFFSEEFNTTLIGSCPYGIRGKVSMNVSELKYRNGLCSYLHRKGELCGECEDNYTLPVYSYYLGCVKCEDYKYGWVKFIAAAFLPLTLFYFIVIVFRISATSPALNGYILVSQIVASTPTISLMYTQLIYDPFRRKSWSTVTIFSTKLVFVLLSIWNLDFFRSFYEHLCLYPNITYQQVLILDYAVAVYPLLLILITYILVKLHDNFAIVVWLWRPFHKCLVLFRKQWNIRSYLINALTTFIVLSYVKILNVSFQLLTSSTVYNMNGTRLHKAYWYYDGRVDLASKEYIPYLILAVLMLVIFNIFPLVLLTLYPFKCFRNGLESLSCMQFKLTLKIFIDTVHGHYKDNMRLFASLYLAVRFLNLLFLSVLRYSYYFKASILMFVTTLVLVARCQPYKCKKSNTIDTVMLFAVISFYVEEIYSADSVTDEMLYPLWFNSIIGFILVMILLCYPVGLVLAKAFPVISRCVRTIRSKLLKKCGSKEGESMLSGVDPQVGYNACDY